MTWNRLLELAWPTRNMQAEINYEVFEVEYLPEIGKRCTAHHHEVREIPGPATCCPGFFLEEGLLWHIVGCQLQPNSDEKEGVHVFLHRRM